MKRSKEEQRKLNGDFEAALDAVRRELLRAYDLFPVDFRSAHEGVAMIDEEFQEFKKAAYWPHKEEKGLDAEEEEATQLAAMCLRYLIDVCYREDTPR